MRYLLLLLLLTTTLLLPGCWDQKEMEELAFVSAIGMDSGPGEGDLTLTVEISTPQESESAGSAASSSKGTKQKSVVFRASGQTYAQAMARLQQIIAHKLFLSQTEVLVVGEEAARKNMSEAVRFLERNSELRRSAAVLITPGKAENVLSTTNANTPKATETIRSLLEQTKETGVAFKTLLRESILLPLSINGIEPIAARVIATRSSGPSDEKGGGNSAGMLEDNGSQGLIPQREGIIRVSGMAAFTGNKLAGWLDEKESRGWGWISGRVRRGYILVLTSRTSQNKSTRVTFHLLGGKSTVKCSIENDEAAVHVTVKVRGEVVEWCNGGERINPTTIRKLESDLADEIKGEVESVLDKAQKEFESDIFGFGFQLSRQHLREWNKEYKDRWTELFPLIPVDVYVETKILHTGTVSESLE